jgi:hypothetical protein
MSQLRNWLVGAGIAVAGGIGTKAVVDYLQNRGQEDQIDEGKGDQKATSELEVAYALVEPNSVQDFLDKSFGNPGRYVANRSPKVFEYQGKQYLIIWSYDNQKKKNQMLVFTYTDAGRDMIASVGYTATVTDYNIELSNTPFAVDINGQSIKSGKGETGGTSNVDLVLA